LGCPGKPRFDDVASQIDRTVTNADVTRAALDRAARRVDKLDAEAARQLRVALAQALWQTGSDRARAVTVAEAVRRDAAAHGDKEALAEAQAWLATHAPRSGGATAAERRSALAT